MYSVNGCGPARSPPYGVIIATTHLVEATRSHYPRVATRTFVAMPEGVVINYDLRDHTAGAGTANSQVREELAEVVEVVHQINPPELSAG